MATLELPDHHKIETSFERVPVVGELVSHEGVQFRVVQVTWENRMRVGSVHSATAHLVLELVGDDLIEKVNQEFH